VKAESPTDDSTLWTAIPTKRVCRCVGVPAPGWESSSRVCRQPRRRLPAPIGFTKSSTTASASDFTSRFPLAVEAVSALSARSFLLDGEATRADTDVEDKRTWRAREEDDAI
jgi:hypothetical protein